MKPRPEHYAMALAIAAGLAALVLYGLLVAYHEYAPGEWGRLWP